MAAYRRRVKHVHPDYGGDRRQFELLQQRLQEALRVVDDRDS
jgi:curved DNA-binding protein CbpA